MEKSLFEQVGGTYTQVGDYLLPNLTLTEEAQKSIGIGGQRHARYLKQYHKVIYYNYLTSGKLNAYLADIDKQAEEMFYGRKLQKYLTKINYMELVLVRFKLIFRTIIIFQEYRHF